MAVVCVCVCIMTSQDHNLRFRPRQSSAFVSDTSPTQSNDTDKDTRLPSAHPSASDTMDTSTPTEGSSLKSFTQIISTQQGTRSSSTPRPMYCYNCGVLITGKPHTRPRTRQSGGVFGCDQVPCCRPGCLLRVCYDEGDTSSLGYFREIYGTEVVCAPPRSLLYIPGGMDLKIYHRSMDSNKHIIEEPVDIRTALLPTIVTTVYIEEYPMLGDVTMDKSKSHEINPGTTPTNQLSTKINTTVLKKHGLVQVQNIFKKCAI